MGKITKIAITGGPCAGKTTSLSFIKNAFSSLGYKVLTVPETATELILGGISPEHLPKRLDFQKLRLRLQLEKEKIFFDAASSMPDENILIVCDRGMLDSKCYMTDADFQSVIKQLGENETELRDSYGAVFHLVSTANGASEFYTTENNPARVESPESALELDNKLLSVWVGHPHLRVIGNSNGFESKMQHLISEIKSFLGIPEPLEIERKFLIEYPNIKYLSSLPCCAPVTISQTYLLSDNGDIVRVRKRGSEKGFVYYKTVKSKKDGIKCNEIETRLTESEYYKNLALADPSRKTIEKTRYCLVSGEKYFEIDVFPFWNDKALMEIELTDVDERFDIPAEVKVIREVTGEKEYSNAFIAKSIN